MTSSAMRTIWHHCKFGEGQMFGQQTRHSNAARHAVASHNDCRVDMTVLDDVRSMCASIAASARFVRIDRDRLAHYAASLPLESLRAPELDPVTHYLGEPDATLAYLVSLDAINFGSGYFPHLAKRPGYSGYFTVAASLKDARP